ncbi:phospholipase domain-containing protein [Streptomyces tropicalis]|uniref:DUF756 domain-containing protein n=1 Tax=Streptomyces tropicalis TaxID=3034234 RepID=A0ABT6A9R7_9ACTN|nr:phospholipase domain-containing protein [Streptomyces tropicalis]MDF3301396.1 DUF756 domain-containing protein [Streptomyces tropicalis]
MEPGTGKFAICFRMANTVRRRSRSPSPRSPPAATARGRTPVAAGSSTEDVLDVVAQQDGWYDLTVAVDSDPTWSRRFTGHLGTGAASVTG